MIGDPTGPDPSGARSNLRLSSEICCGLCRAWWITENARSRTHAAKMARTSGWRLTKRDGWICPECAKPKGVKP